MDRKCFHGQEVQYTKRTSDSHEIFHSMKSDVLCLMHFQIALLMSPTALGHTAALAVGKRPRHPDQKTMPVPGKPCPLLRL
jgi:hypothetical protein